MTATTRANDLSGSPIRDHRRALRLTQGELARRVPCSRSTVKAIEAGQRWPSVPMLLALARALHCRPEDLLDYSGQAKVS